MREARILIAAREAPLAATYARSLTGLGYAIAASVFSSAEAVRLAEHSRPDLVLLDSQLPGALDGLAAASCLEKTHGLPVVLLVPASATVLEQALAARTTGVLVLPAEALRLRAAVEMALARHANEQALRQECHRLAVLRNDTPGPRPTANAGVESPGLPLPGLLPGTETVLLVEDEPMVRDLNRHILRLCGYTVLEAGDGVEALRVAAAHGGLLDLLVTDVLMPRLNGTGLAQILTAERPRLKVLFLSGFVGVGGEDLAAGARPAGSGFLAKPYAPRELARAVRALLDAGSLSP